MADLATHRSPADHRHAALRCTRDAMRATEAGHRELAEALAELSRRHHDLADAVDGVMRCGLDDLAPRRTLHIAS
jgi:hypothetical protein